jgi:hypothetical protein
VALRILNGLMAALLAYASIVNVNDPDALRWVVMYGAAALTAAVAAFRPARLPWVVPAAMAVVAGVWAATLAPHVLGHVRWAQLWESYEMKDAMVEEGREFYGLGIAAVWMVVVALTRAFARRPAAARR